MLSMKAKSGESLLNQDMIQCIGLESMLSHAIAHVLETRKNHCVRLSSMPTMMSHMSSQESRVRSHKVAVRCVELEE
jgi:hypothetical protein